MLLSSTARRNLCLAHCLDAKKHLPFCPLLVLHSLLGSSLPYHSQPALPPSPPSPAPLSAMAHCTPEVLQAMAILNGVERSLSGAAPGAKKRTRHGSSPSKMTCEDMAKHSFPTLKSSSLAEHEPDDSLDWPTTGPFTYHRWHVMIERWAPCLLVKSMQCIMGTQQSFIFAIWSLIMYS